MTLNRFLLLLATTCFAASSLADPNPFEGNPPWWQARGVLRPNEPAKDYAAVNQGQLKNMVTAAFQECASKLALFNRPLNEPDALRDLVNGWDDPGTKDYAMVTQGHVKALSSMFFDRFAELGLWPLTNPRTYPWQDNFASRDYSSANTGQLKNLFRFFFPAVDPYNDTIMVPNSGLGCGAGAFSLALAAVNGVPDATIDWVQVSGPGSGTWAITTPGLETTLGPNPGHAVIAAGTPPAPYTASICVAGEYTFGARISYPDEPLVGIGFVTAAYEVSHSSSDPAINFAVGGAIANVPDPNGNQTWEFFYDSCSLGSASEGVSCSGVGQPIIDGRQRAIPWEATQSNLADNIHELKLISTSDKCHVFIRFTVPEGIGLQVAGPGYGTANYINPEQSAFQTVTRTGKYQYDVTAHDGLPATTIYLFRFIRP